MIPLDCPKCKADLRNTKMLLSEAEAYGGHEYFSRVIGVYCTQTDRVHCWRCPDCGYEWERTKERK